MCKVPLRDRAAQFQAAEAKCAAIRHKPRAYESALQKELADFHSLKCSFEIVLATAKDAVKASVLFQPHTLDFRGRAYPAHPHLQHMGSDLVRGLLVFGVAKVRASLTGLGGARGCPLYHQPHDTCTHLPRCC